jgi:ATP-dependent exoDNAse (exonuclease V) alpha subunit
VKKIANNEIFVSFNNGEPELKLEKETWKNVRYNYNKEKDNIEEEELGSFIQYPIRLAWAITIHKSQGLTFEKAVIDAGSSFAAGQVYVALSRCTSLDGLVLHSRIFPHSIATDPRV